MGRCAAQPGTVATEVSPKVAAASLQAPLWPVRRRHRRSTWDAPAAVDHPGQPAPWCSAPQLCPISSLRCTDRVCRPAVDGPAGDRRVLAIRPMR